MLPSGIRRVLLASLALLLAGCLGTARPDTAEWLPKWEAVVDLVPDRQDLGDPPDENLCQTTLAAIRDQSEELLPTPTQTVDDLVEEWVAVAEAAFFECPPAGEEIASFDDAYQQLATLEQSIRSTLEGAG